MCTDVNDMYCQDTYQSQQDLEDKGLREKRGRDDDSRGKHRARKKGPIIERQWCIVENGEVS